MASESVLRKKDWLEKGCNAFDNKNPISKPMSFWTEQDVLTYLKKIRYRLLSHLWRYNRTR